MNYYVKQNTAALCSTYHFGQKRNVKVRNGHAFRSRVECNAVSPVDELFPLNYFEQRAAVPPRKVLSLSFETPELETARWLMLGTPW